MKLILVFKIFVCLVFASNITDDQIKTIFKLCNNSNISQTELNIILKKYNVTSIIHLTDIQANNIINELYVDYPKKLQEITTNRSDSTKIRINEKDNIKNIIYNPMTGEQILENDSTKSKLFKSTYSKLKFPEKSDINKKNIYFFIGAGPSLTDNFKKFNIHNEKSSYQNGIFNIGVYSPFNKGLGLGINIDYPFFKRSLIGITLSVKEQKIRYSKYSNSKKKLSYYILSASLIHFLNEFNNDTFLYTNIGFMKRGSYRSYWWRPSITLGIGHAFKFKAFTILPAIDYNKSFDSFLNIKVSFLF